MPPHMGTCVCGGRFRAGFTFLAPNLSLSATEALRARVHCGHTLSVQTDNVHVVVRGTLLLFTAVFRHPAWRKEASPPRGSPSTESQCRAGHALRVPQCANRPRPLRCRRSVQSCCGRPAIPFADFGAFGIQLGSRSRSCELDQQIRRSALTWVKSARRTRAFEGLTRTPSQRQNPVVF